MRTAIYTRISQDTAKDDQERQGVQRQAEACHELADKLGWQVSEVFEDNDISAYSGKKRPRFEALLKAIKHGEVDALICWHPDRLYRSMKDLERLIDIADEARVQIRTVNGGDLDLSNSSGRMLARILGSVARQESEHKGERQQAANLQRAEAGNWQTANRVFGYTQDGQPLEPEATYFRQAVADVLAGKSIQSISRDWNARGIKTTMAGKTRPSVNGQPGKPFKATWTAPAVRRLIVNPRFAAIRVHKGREIGSGAWQPLISVDDHRALVAKLSDPSRIRCTSFERKYIGSGLYVCGRCGGTMKAAVPGGRKSRAYTCRDHAHILRSGEPVDAFVSEIVLQRLESENLVVTQEVDLSALQRERDGLQGRLDSLTDDFADGLLDRTQLQRGSATIRARLAGLDRQISEATAANPLADLLSQQKKIRQRWAEMSPKQQAEVIDRIAVVTILPCPKGLRRFDSSYIRVEWRGEDSQ